MTINVLSIINTANAINMNDGISLFSAIKLSSPSELTISFEDINHVSSAFLNESIGKFAQLNPTNIDQLSFIFPEDKEIFKYKVESVIENALLGDTYDSFVDNALMSL